MKTYVNPSEEQFKSLQIRPLKNKAPLENLVLDIINAVKTNGDRSLLDFARTLDGVKIKKLKVSDKKIDKVELPVELEKAIQLAKNNISKFHESQLQSEQTVETTKGVRCWRKSVPIDRVGLYIPGGSAPLLSTVLMLGVPAQIAGCKEIILCTPPNKQGKVDPAIIYTARLLGIRNIFKVGGAQAIAAMAYGTKEIPKVSKIFGPGNQFVTKAKELVQLSGVAIDLPAGPSELLVIADDSSDPSFIAADLLSQAEHGPDSQVVLLTTSERLAERVSNEISKQIISLPRLPIIEEALKNSFCLVLDSIDNCLKFSNSYAPEHLIISTKENDRLVENVVNAGSVFIGDYSCESAGDYASGTNHTLPTNGYAKNFSGVSVESFMKRITFQEISSEGIQNIGPAVELMAEAEQLLGHKNAVSIRLKSLENV